MKQEEVDQIANSVLDKLEHQRTVDIETHRKHHEYIDTLITESENLTARKEQWIRVVGGWGLIAALTILLTAIWHYLKDNIN